MMRINHFAPDHVIAALLLAVALAWPQCCAAQGEDDAAQSKWGEIKKGSNVAEWISDTVKPLTIGVPVVLYLTGDRDHRDAAKHMINAQALGQLVVKILKNTTDEPRPREPWDDDGFPSGHAAAAWALATVVADQYPDYKWPAYAWAAAATWSRRGARYHTWAQALAGAFIGWGAARLELSSSHGLFLHTDDGSAPSAMAQLWPRSFADGAGFSASALAPRQPIAGGFDFTVTLVHLNF